MNFIRYSVACIIALFALSAHADVPASVQVTKPIIFVPLGKAKSTQAILSIKNTGQEALSLVKVTSPLAKKIVLVPSVDNTKAPVSALNPWTISTNQTLDMKSDKTFLSFEGLKYQISTGDDVEITLWFSDSKKITIMAKAKSAYDQKHSY